MRVLIVFDNPRRDQVGVINLARELSVLGHEVFISGLLSASIDAFYVEPHVVIHTYLRRNNVLFHKRLANSGAHNVVIESEGIVGKDMDEYLNFISKCPKFEFLTRYFCWGESQVESLTLRYPNYRSLFRAMGNPRFDEIVVSSPIRHKRGYVLVNTNFPIINPKFNESFSAEYKANRIVGHDVDVLLQKKRASLRVREGLCIAVEKLAALMPTTQFVLRPHPFESAEYYFFRFKNISNIVIETEGSSITVISKSSCLIQVNCTTALEASMLGIPVFMPDYFNEEILRYQASEVYSLKVFSFDDLHDRIEEILNERAKYPRVLKSPLLELPVEGSAKIISSDISLISPEGSFRTSGYFFYFLIRLLRLMLFRSIRIRILSKGYDALLVDEKIIKVKSKCSSGFLFKYIS